MSLESYLDELTQEDVSLRYGDLDQLSSLGSEEIEIVHNIWHKMSAERRLDLVSHLVETSEENVDMDFTSIFKFALKDEAEGVRTKAVSGLWECEERPLITTFIKLMEGDPSTKVQTAAAQALGKFAELAEDGKLLALDRGRIQNVLLPLVKNENHPLIHLLDGGGRRCCLEPHRIVHQILGQALDRFRHSGREQHRRTSLF